MSPPFPLFCCSAPTRLCTQPDQRMTSECTCESRTVVFLELTERQCLSVSIWLRARVGAAPKCPSVSVLMSVALRLSLHRPHGASPIGDPSSSHLTKCSEPTVGRPPPHLWLIRLMRHANAVTCPSVPCRMRCTHADPPLHVLVFEREF